MKIFLKDATKKHFEKQALSQAQLNTFEKMIKEENVNGFSKSNNTQNKKETGVSLYFNKWLSFAAMLILCVSSVLFWSFPEKEQGLTIAKEVVKNHIRLRPLEVNSENFDIVGTYFTQLDFNLTKSKLINNNHQLTMLGGRYCSIQSEIAAQLRYQDKQGNVHTLYQVGYDPEIFDDIQNNLQASIYDVDGFKVSIWVEKGLLMANVSPY